MISLSLGPILSGCKKSVFINQKSKSKTDKRKNLVFQSYRTCRHAGHFFKINSRRQEKLEGYVGIQITNSRRNSCSAVRLHKPRGAMLAPRATRAQRAHRSATITKRVLVLLDVLALLDSIDDVDAPTKKRRSTLVLRERRPFATYIRPMLQDRTFSMRFRMGYDDFMALVDLVRPASSSLCPSLPLPPPAAARYAASYAAARACPAANTSYPLLIAVLLLRPLSAGA